MADITPTHSEVEEPFRKTHDDDLPKRHHAAPAAERAPRMPRAGLRPGDRARTSRSWPCPTPPSSPTMIFRQFDHIVSLIGIDRVGCGSDWIPDILFTADGPHSPRSSWSYPTAARALRHLHPSGSRERSATPCPGTATPRRIAARSPAATSTGSSSRSGGSWGGPPRAEPTQAGELPSPRNAGRSEHGGSGPVPSGRGAGPDRRRGVAPMTSAGVEA